MNRITKRFLLFLVGLGLFTVIPMTLSPNVVIADNDKIQSVTQPSPIKDIENAIDDDQSETPKDPLEIKKDLNTSDDGLTPAPKNINEEPMNEMTVFKEISNGEKKEDSHTVFIIVMALNFLCTVALFLLFKNNSQGNHKMEKSGKNSSVAQDDLNKQQRDGDKLDNGNIRNNDYIIAKLQNFEERLSNIEKNHSDLEKKLRDLLIVVKHLNEVAGNLQKMSEESSRISDFNSGQKIFVENKSTQPGTSFNYKQNFNSQESAKGGEILTAFNKMMNEVAKKSGYEGKAVRSSFAEKYRVIAFKCINAQERANRSEIPPIFEACTTLFDNESMFWGVPLADGTLLVFPNPNLSSYESTVHFRGGMKELFDSNYSGGNYRKIDVKQPAIMTRDLKNINRKGKLELNTNT